MSSSFAAEPARAIFAGGCFWCVEAELQELDGVFAVTSGYTGGKSPNPTYKNMGDHVEAVEVEYDPEKISYEKLLDAFWSNIDPTDAGGQFYDRGNQYQTAIFYSNATQQQLAEQSKAEKAQQLGKAIVTPILPAQSFYPAEEYHQDFYKKDPDHYQSYKKGSRREESLKNIWQNK